MAGRGKTKRSSAAQVAKPVMSDLDTTVEALARKKLRVQKGGHSVEISSMEAVLQKPLATAMAGGSHAQGQFIENVRRSEKARRAVIDKAVEDWTRIKQHQIREFQRYREQYGADPEIYPHQDDIVIDASTGVRIVGPLNREDYKRAMKTIRLVDAYLLQDALDWARQGRRKNVTIERGDPCFMAMLLNQGLPPRLRRKGAWMIARRITLAARSKRDLLRETHQAWKLAGEPRPRGSWGPDQEVGSAFLGVFTDFMKLWRDDQLTKDEKGDEIEASVQRRLGRFVKATDEKS